MRRALHVAIGAEGSPLGTLHYAQEGAREHAAFEYSRAWLDTSDGFPIDPELPLRPGLHFRKPSREGSVFHRAIADTGPDGWARRVIRRDHAKQRQEARLAGTPAAVTQLDELDFLLAVDDVSRVGALRLQDESGVFRRATEPGRRGVPPLIELRTLLGATRAVETSTETAADLAYLRGRGTSLGGLRPKCSVVDDQGRLAIGKLPSISDERSVAKGEVLALHLAEAAGIDAAEARLVESDGTPVALIRRFDRTDDGGRLMYVSAATLLGVDTTDPHEHAYTELVDLIRRAGASPQRDVEELWRRIAFSILITNVDDHLKNHGFLHVHRGQWRLSPAFDVNPFPDRVRELKTWISEDAGPDASIDALLSATRYFRIAEPRARAILADVESAVSRWRVVGTQLGMTRAELDAFEDAFEHEERAAARRALA